MAYPQLKPDHIRGGRLYSIAGAGKDYFVGTGSETSREYGHRGADIAMIRRSVFTFCPAGFGRWSFRFVQALHYGSIPVLLSDAYVLPYQESIPWEELVIRVPERSLDSVPEILLSMRSERVRAMQAALIRWRTSFSERGVQQLILESLAKRV